MIYDKMSQNNNIGLFICFKKTKIQNQNKAQNSHF